jgi:hypothetical protein
MATVTVTSDLGYFHINEALTQFAQGYGQDADAFIGDKLAPVIQVDAKSDQYYNGLTEHLQLSDTARAPGSLFPQVEWALSEDGYLCKSFGVEVRTPFEMPKNADAAIAVDEENVTLAVDRLMLASEYRIMNALSATGTFVNFQAGKTITGSGSNVKWTAGTVGANTADPYNDIETAKAGVVAATGHLPNTIWMNYNTYRELKLNSNIMKRVLYSGALPGAVITDAILAQVFDVENVYVGKAVFDASIPGSGATPTMSFLWPDGVVGVSYVDNRIGPLRAKILAPMRQFVWTAMGGRFATRSYVFDPANSNVVQCVDYVDEKVTCAGAQVLITSVI